MIREGSPLGDEGTETEMEKGTSGCFQIHKKIMKKNNKKIILNFIPVIYTAHIWGFAFKFNSLKDASRLLQTFSSKMP